MADFSAVLKKFKKISKKLLTNLNASAKIITVIITDKQQKRLRKGSDDEKHTSKRCNPCISAK